MWRLTQRMRSERGASATVVAFMLVPLLGAGAIAIDVGAMYAERAQLQNGVDAAALAIAAVCARDEADCASPSALTSVAQTYVVANAAILRAPAADEPTISVTDDTVTVTAKTSVGHELAQLLTGTSASDVTASGSAEWGQPISGEVIPFGFGICEFESVEAAGPGETPEKIAIELGTQARRGCDVTNNPGGFGWLNASGCRVQFDLSGGELWHLGESGLGGGASGCSPVAATLDPLLDTVILIPIYDSFKFVRSTCADPAITSPTKECYRIAKFAAFHLTGGKMPSFNEIDPTAPPCANGCLQGYFVKYVAVDDAFELGAGSPGGLSVVRPILTPDERADLIG